jgi:threonylcarbamoyladenosine tRNA methylthiotransferase MtaB
MKRVAVTTLGCKTNQFESAAMIEQLENSGYRIVPFCETADIYIINSCTVTAKTDAETRRLIRRARRNNPQSHIVATGCYAQVAPGELERMPELDIVLGNREKQQISALLESTVNQVSDISKEEKSEPLKLTSFAEHTRAFLQVQNGCNSYCAYCIVPFARGRSRSVTPDGILQGVRELAANGFKEVVLTGIHLGAYGLDLANQTSLTNLVDEIVAGNLVPRLRIGSIEPNEVEEDLLTLMAESKIICPHLHLPLQSGSDTVLKRMGRQYSSHFFRELTTKVASLMPHAFIGADLIAGFPGETDAEFEETIKLLDDLPFSDLHIFPYSNRPGTRAAGMSGQLPSPLIKERASRLRCIAEIKKREFLGRQIGLEHKVLVHGFNAITRLCKGLSDNYVVVFFPGEEALINLELKVTIVCDDGETCSGILSGN